jgi:hypothetical protein
MMDPSALAVLRRQQITSRELDGIRERQGDEAARIMCGGLAVGVVDYMVRHYGTRRTYDYIQQLADNIADEDLPR